MDEDFPSRTYGVRRRRNPWGVVVGVVAGAFVLGAIASWALFRPGDLAFPELLSIKSDDTARAASPGVTATGAVEEFAGQQGELDQHISDLEQRLARLDVQADAAAGNATRAEGLLIAFAARRVVERGDKLGYLASQLQMRFGAAEPDAVKAVLAADSKPVTLDRLLAGLDRLAPQLGEGATNEGTLDWLSRELGELFVVRREGSPSPAPERRLERARWFLESGRAEAAVAEVHNLPNADKAGGWIADANRYAAAQRGLERIEAAAILGPEDLRDGTGQPINGLSPTTGP
jgi:hypothetical protein